MIAQAPSPGSPVVNAFGDLQRDGFRLIWWGHRGENTGRYWFAPQSLVLGLNLAGTGALQWTGERRAISPRQGFLVAPHRTRCSLESVDAEHRFVGLEMRRQWVARWLPRDAVEVCDPVRAFLSGEREDVAYAERTLSAALAQVAQDLDRPPGATAALPCWHHAKALELVAHGLVVEKREELFCERTKQLGRERVERVREILTADLENPPSLSELGKLVGCSPFYLSRTFRQETGVTISAFLRRARMDRAAEMLRAGEGNVTEAAFSVGYASLSHFSKAFSETFGCCPCLYGRKSMRTAKVA